MTLIANRTRATTRHIDTYTVGRTRHGIILVDRETRHVTEVVVPAKYGGGCCRVSPEYHALLGRVERSVRLSGGPESGAARDGTAIFGAHLPEVRTRSSRGLRPKPHVVALACRWR